MIELTPQEQIALASVFKEDPIKALKRSLSAGSHPVDFTVRINGTVSKEANSADTIGSVDPTVDLKSFDVCCAVLRELGIGPTRLMDALAKIASPDKIVSDEKLTAAFAAEEAKRVKRMAKIPTTTPGRSGKTSVIATATKIVKGKR